MNRRILRSPPAPRLAVPARTETAADCDPLSAYVANIVERDQAALEALYGATVSRVFHLARAMVGNDADAEEVTSDVYLQTWMNARTYVPDRGSVLTWLLTICRSRALDLLRRRRTRSSMGVLYPPAAEIPDPATLAGLSGRVHSALAALALAQRQVIGLAYFRGMTHSEIAAVTGLATGTVNRICIVGSLR